MKGIFINCPSKQCKKILMKNVYLRPGSFLTTKCYWCGASVEVISEQNRIILKPIVDKSDLTDEDDDGIVNLSI